MTQAHMRRKSAARTLSGHTKKGHEQLTVIAYVTDVFVSPRALKGIVAKVPRDAKVAIVSNKRVFTSKTKPVYRSVEELQLYERKKSESSPMVRSEADAYEPNARARAVLRGVKLMEQDLKASGGAYSLEQVQELMRGVTRQAVNNRVRDGSLLAVPGPSNRAVYPVVQFTSDGSPVGGLKAIREALQTNSSGMLLNFLVHPEARLDGEKPIDLLKAGRLEKVIEAAQHVGIQGA